jgi:peptide deformylase
MQNDKRRRRRMVFNEGCLVFLMFVKMFIETTITIEYWKRFCHENRGFDGLIARVIQHEYDHIEGILFTDVSSLKKRLIQKLKNIIEGKHSKSTE